MKKIVLSLGTVSLCIVPVSAVLACGESATSETSLSFAKSDVALFETPTTGQTNGNIKDIVVDTFWDVTNITNAEIVKNLAAVVQLLKAIKNDSKEKISITLEYKDAKVTVEVSVKYNGAQKPVATVNKVTITKGSTEYNPSSDTNASDEDKANLVKINAFKDYTKKLIYAVFNVSKELVNNPSGLTMTTILEEISKTTI